MTHRVTGILWTIILATLAFTTAAHSQFGPLSGQQDDRRQGGPADSSERVKVEVVAGYESVAPGGRLPVAVILDHDDGWHTYHNKGDIPKEFIRTSIAAGDETDERLVPHIGFAEWPDGKPYEFDFLPNPVEFLEGRTVVIVPFTIAEDAEPGEAELTLHVTYQACDDKQCLKPVTDEPHTATVNVVAAGDADAALTDPDLFSGFPEEAWQRIEAGEIPDTYVDFMFFEVNIAGLVGFSLLLLIAAVGGFLLNLTPCVLPVIPIKIMSLTQQAGNRGKCFSLGIAMALGIVALWLAIGSAIAVFGTFTSTNELFQYPAFSITVGLIIAAMAIGMCGLFAVRLPQWVYTINPSHDSYHGSFGFGIMTGILALPCTAPFMGAAIAAATIFQPSTALTVFAAIGAGQAIPYVILAAYPQLIDKLPKAGPASELVKQVMGLLMLAAAAFFLGVGLSAVFVNPPAPPSKAYIWAVGAFVVLAGLWLAWRTFRITSSSTNRAVFSGLAVVMIAAAVIIPYRLTAPGPVQWEYYTAERFAAATDRGDVVVLEFTAEWCINCKFLERNVLYTDAVAGQLNAEGVTPMKVDLTGNNHAGNDLLNKLGRRSIPLLIVFNSNGEQIFTEDWYTPGQVLAALEEAGATRLAAGNPSTN